MEVSESLIDKYRYYNVEHIDWWEYTYNEFTERMKQKGIGVDRMFFSGFWSQGDGASWSGDVRLPVFVEKYVPASIGRDCWLWLFESGWVHDRLNIYQKGNHYCHSHTMSVGNIEDYSHDADDHVLELDCILKGTPIGTLWHLILADTSCPIKRFDDLEELVLTEARNYADKIYKTLQSGYEAECDEDQVSECYDANNVLFNEEGVIV